MDLKRLEPLLKRKIGEIHQLRYRAQPPIDQDDFERRLAKARRVQNLVRATAVAREKRADKNHRYELFLRAMNYIHEDITAGRRLMAIDIEWTIATQTIEQIGISTYQNGVHETRNIEIEGRPRTGVFEFGTTVVMSQEEAFQHLINEAELSQRYVGHSLIKADFQALKVYGIVLPSRRVLDTGWYSNWELKLDDGMEKLSHLCARYNIPTSNLHVGGNDARYSMEVLLAMVNRHVVDSEE